MVLPVITKSLFKPQRPGNRVSKLDALRMLILPKITSTLKRTVLIRATVKPTKVTVKVILNFTHISLRSFSFSTRINVNLVIN